MLRDLIATGDAVGDPELVRRLAELRGRLTHTIAAAVVDLDARPACSWARLTTSKPRSRLQPDAKVDADPRFELGSVTKGLTGMLLADAIARGELALDSTAGEILARRPSLAERTAGPLHELTLRELCTHTSGLPRIAPMPGRLARFALLGLDPYRGRSAEAVLLAAAHQRLRGRGSYRYSNLGGAVAGQLLAIAAGDDFGVLLHDRIFAPLQMDSATVGARGQTAAWGRSATGLVRQPWALDGYAPAGGVIATIEDTATLTAALVDGSAPGIRSLAPLADAAPSAPGREAGIFWLIEPLPGDGPTLTWHNGQTGGYSAFVGIVRDRRRGVAVLADIARAPEQRRIAMALLQ